MDRAKRTRAVVWLILTLAAGCARSSYEGPYGDADEPAIEAAEEAPRREVAPAPPTRQAGDVLPQVIYHGTRAQRWVALTFDDGPDDLYTPRMLDVLARLRVQATFFVTGQHARRYPTVTQRIVDEGHELGNHGYNHADLTRLPLAQMRWQLEQTDEILERFAGRPPRVFRPPYGARNSQLIKLTSQMGLRVVMWSVDSQDWRGKSGQAILDNELTNVASGSIILRHSAGGPGEDLSGSVASLPALITNLRQRGYTFVTLSRLLGLED